MSRWSKPTLTVAGSLLGALVSLAGAAAPAAGQTIGPRSFTDTDLADPAFADHLPRAVVQSHKRLAFDAEFSYSQATLWAVTSSGIRERRFDSYSRAWAPWVTRGNHTAVDRIGDIAPVASTIAPSLWGRNLAMTAGHDGSSAKVRGFFPFADASGTGRVGLPTLTGRAQPIDLYGQPYPGAPTYDWRRLAQPAGGFIPRTGFSRTASGSERVNVFGTDALGQNLVEAFWNGSTWTFSTHALPVAGGSPSVKIGSQSAVWDAANGRGYVFVEIKFYASGTSVDDGVWCRYWNGSQWTWVPLGTSIHGSTTGANEYGLAAVGYPLDGQFHVRVYAVFRSIDTSPANQDALYEMHIVGAPQGVPIASGRRSGPWTYFVRPPAPAGVTSGWSTTPFRMTSAVVWYEGTRGVAANLRIDVFGYADQGALVHFERTPTTWSWAASRTAPGGDAIRVDSAFVVDEGTYDRISAIGRTRSGRIIERYRVIDAGVDQGYAWLDHTLYTLQPIGPISPISSPLLP